jgi:hypothetical protein
MTSPTGVGISDISFKSYLYKSQMYNQMSPTFGAADALLRDYESKAPFW